MIFLSSIAWLGVVNLMIAAYCATKASADLGSRRIVFSVWGAVCAGTALAIALFALFVSVKLMLMVHSLGIHK
ncbi:MAG TPA: hypothetical protein VME40_17270 [Caulobacteraceae bacterium]|nr:hypothetical protein [Caulobacteraceae bacterium]